MRLQYYEYAAIARDVPPLVQVRLQEVRLQLDEVAERDLPLGERRAQRQNQISKRTPATASITAISF